MVRIALLFSLAGVGLAFAPSAYVGRKGASTPFDRRSSPPRARVPRACALKMSSHALTSAPSWEDIEAKLKPEAAVADPILTLYRDNNGWCPFCERVQSPTMHGLARPPLPLSTTRHGHDMEQLPRFGWRFWRRASRSRRRPSRCKTSRSGTWIR